MRQSFQPPIQTRRRNGRLRHRTFAHLYRPYQHSTIRCSIWGVSARLKAACGFPRLWIHPIVKRVRGSKEVGCSPPASHRVVPPAKVLLPVASCCLFFLLKIPVVSVDMTFFCHFMSISFCIPSIRLLRPHLDFSASRFISCTLSSGNRLPYSRISLRHSFPAYSRAPVQYVVLPNL